MHNPSMLTWLSLDYRDKDHFGHGCSNASGQQGLLELAHADTKAPSQELALSVEAIKGPHLA